MFKKMGVVLGMGVFKGMCMFKGTSRRKGRPGRARGGASKKEKRAWGRRKERGEAGQSNRRSPYISKNTRRTYDS